MAYKARTVPMELKILRLLNVRFNLSEKEKQHLVNLEKGFEGEQLFDSLTENLECECLVLNDLLLNYNSTFQNDSILIFGDNVDLYEVKNFEGDYDYSDDKFYFLNTKVEIANPLNQLNRSASNLRQLLQSLGFNMKVNAYVIFVNPKFMLYQAKRDLPFIFPSQIPRHFEKLNAKGAKLTRRHELLAEKLVELHMEENPFIRLPSYNYEMLKKGIACEECHNLLVNVDGYSCVCMNCGHKESVDSAVMRSVAEIRLLFPDKKITTNLVEDWCGVVNNRRVSRILNKYLKIVKLRRWSYYE